MHVLALCRVALRPWRRAPFLAASAALALAVGIGLNGGLASLFRGVSDASMPYEKPAELVDIWLRNPRISWMSELPVSMRDLSSWRDRAVWFTGIAAFTAPEGVTYDVAAHGRRVSGHAAAAYATANTLRVLGTAPVLGMSWPNQGQVHGRNVLVSYAFWKEAFVGDDSVVGTTIVIGSEPFAVIGVLPRLWRLPNTGRVDILIPLRLDAAVAGHPDDRALMAIGRLGPGVTLAQATSGMAATAVPPPLALGKPPDRVEVNLVALKADATRGIDYVAPIFLVITSCVLVLAFANLLVALLARAHQRSLEFAVRSALGAGTFQIFRQILVETAAPVALGVLLSIPVVACGPNLELRYPSVAFTSIRSIPFDPSALLLVAAVGIAVWLLLSIGTTWRLRALSRSGLSPMLSASPRGLGGAGRTPRIVAVLVGCEVTLSLGILGASLALAAGVMTLDAASMGFAPDNVVIGRVTQPQSQRADLNLARFNALLAHLRATLPGSRVALAQTLPLTGTSLSAYFVVPGSRAGATQATASVNVVTASYFSALGIPVALGRSFAAGDRSVAIVNSTLAQKYWPGEDPIGRQIVLPRPPMAGDGAVSPGTRTVIGVAGDTKCCGPGSPPWPQVYVPYPGEGTARSIWVVVRSSQPGVAGAIRKAAAWANEGAPAYGITTLSDLVRESRSGPNGQAAIVGLLGIVAAFLSIVGVYGIASAAVARHLPEYAVRLALGASRHQITRLAVGGILRLYAWALLPGIALAAVLTHVMAHLIVGIPPVSPAYFLTAAAALGLSVTAACIGPIIRAQRVHPAVLLRME